MITDIWRHQVGKYFCISTKSKSAGWRDRFFTRDEWDDAEALIERHAPQEDVYFATNGFSERGRGKHDAEWGVWLYADLDEVEPWELEPTLAIRTSPGRYQAWWRCDAVVSDDLNQRLTYHLGADKGGWGANKVLRIPGTINHKYAALPRVALIWDGGPTYRVSELDRLLPKRERERRAATQLLVSVKPSASVKELMRAYGVKNIYMGHAGDRSRAIYGIWSPMVEGGATLEQVLQVVQASRSWQSKLDDDDGWCDDEIERIERAMG